VARIILVRHGQTQWNREERFRGRADLALTELGLRQARATAERLARMGVSQIYSSPLRRALETARIIGQRLGIPAQPLEELIDIDFGDWQGLSPQEARERDGELYHLWSVSPHRVKFPGGESLGNVRQRVSQALEKVVAEHPEETVVLVSHMVACRVMICAVLGIDNSHFWQIGQDVCAINIFETRGDGLALRLLNDTCHLQGL